MGSSVNNVSKAVIEAASHLRSMWIRNMLGFVEFLAHVVVSWMVIYLEVV